MPGQSLGEPLMEQWPGSVACLLFAAETPTVLDREEEGKVLQLLLPEEDTNCSGRAG